MSFKDKYNKLHVFGSDEFLDNFLNLSHKFSEETSKNGELINPRFTYKRFSKDWACVVFKFDVPEGDNAHYRDLISISISDNAVINTYKKEEYTDRDYNAIISISKACGFDLIEDPRNINMCL